MNLTGRAMLMNAAHLYADALQGLSSSGWSPAPILINCIVTYRCNIHCSFCISEAGRNSDSLHELDAMSWNRIFEQIPAMAVLGFSGGEVFTHADPRGILEAACRRHRCGVVTNGIGWDDDRFRWLAELAPENPWSPGLLNVGWSLNDPYSDEGKRRRRWADMDMFRRRFRDAGDKGPRLELKVPVKEDTAPWIDDIARRAVESGWDTVAFQMLTPIEYMFFQDPDTLDDATRAKWREYRYGENAVPKFKASGELLAALRRLSELPASIRNRVNLMPDISLDRFADYYAGRLDWRTLRCSHPMVHAAINPRGVLYQCLNPDGVDLTKTPFQNAWNDAGFRDFRRELRERGTFARCASCCFSRSASRPSAIPG